MLKTNSRIRWFIFSIVMMCCFGWSNHTDAQTMFSEKKKGIETKQQDIQDEQKASISVTIKNNQNRVNTMIDDEARMSKDDYQIRVNDRYQFSTNSGINYYSYREQEVGFSRIYLGDVELHWGDKVTLLVKKESDRYYSIIQEIKVTREMLPNIELRSSGLKNFHLHTHKLLLFLDSKAQRDENHYVVTKNGQYIASSNHGTIIRLSIEKQS